MEINKIDRCARCMKELDSEAAFCPDCGYDQRQGNSERALPVGTILNDKYSIGAVIGEGGFGITYTAWDRLIGTRIAIKEYFPSGLVTRNTTLLNEKAACNLTLIQESAGEGHYRKGLERFVKEAENLAKFQKQPGVVSVKDFFYENNTAYMVMEYIDGVTLNSYLESHGGKLEKEEDFQMMEPVMKTLEAIHKEGVIHRDISPDNIMVTADGQMKLIDFGAARFVGADDEKSLTVILKHGYAPEEQYRSNGAQGSWTDVYALSAVIYRMLTGKVPEETLKRMTEKQDSVRIELEKVPGLSAAERKHLEKGLAVKADRRYQTIGAFYDGLYGRKKQEGRKWMAGVGVAIVALCVFIIGLGDHKTEEIPAETERVQEVPAARIPSPIAQKDKNAEKDMVEGTTEEVTPEEPVEPENIRELREYYNENCSDQTGNVYFVDLNGDGEDEMIVTESVMKVTEYSSTEITEYRLTIYQHQNGIVKAIYETVQSPQENPLEGTDYYLSINEDVSLLARHWEYEIKDWGVKNHITRYLEKISFKQVESGTTEISELTQEEALEQRRHSVLLIGSSQYGELPGNSGKKLENYQNVLENKEGISDAIEIAENAGEEILNYAVIYDNDIPCTFAVTGELGEFLQNVPATVWALYDGHIEKAEILDGDAVLLYQLKNCDIFQFGNSHHYFVTTVYPYQNGDLVQHKFCFENSQIRETDEEYYFVKDEKGKIQIETDGYLAVFGEKNASVTGWLADHYYIDMFYYDGEYVEYGAEQIDNDEMEQYENYHDVLQTVEEEFSKGAEIGLIRMGTMDYTVEKIELDHIRRAANNVYYLNYRVYGTTPFWNQYKGEELNLWAHAVLEATGRQLEFKGIVWTKKEEESGLGFPLYYGPDRELVKPGES